MIGSKTVTFDEIPAWAKPYTVASVPRLLPWVDPTEPGSSFHMTDAIKAVVAVEGPVHIDILYGRLRDAWDIGRVGRNIRANIDSAILQAGVIRGGDFLTTPSGGVTVRTPTDCCQRSIGQVHDRELDLALVGLAGDAAGIGHDELTMRVAIIYGWERRGADIAARVQDRITALLETDILGGTLDDLTVVCRA